MDRTKLSEAFHGEGDLVRPLLENAGADGNEMLTLKVRQGKLTFLARSDESDEQAIRNARFVIGELTLDNDQLFCFWIADEGRGGTMETAVYPSSAPQTG